MKKRLVIAMTGLVIAATTLAGCAATSSPAASGAKSTGASSKPAPAATSDTLSTGSTSLGTIVVNGKGRTVYLFTKDTANSGNSTCYGQCASLWPAVTTTSASPTVKGVTGTVGTIKRTDGTMQVTLNGWPLYTFASDASVGAVSGQGVMGIWFAVSPSGTEVTAKPKAPTSGSSSDSSSGSSAGGGWS